MTLRVLNIAIACVVLGAFLAGCERPTETRQADGFVLPEGSAERGQAVFVEMGCRQCHVIGGTELPDYDGVVSLQIELGGKAARIKDYGELLTSIVNPEHSIAKAYKRLQNTEEAARGSTPMPNFNGRMTVAELIDLVQFLHSRYEALVPDYRGYRYYYGP